MNNVTVFTTDVLTETGVNLASTVQLQADSPYFSELFQNAIHRSSQKSRIVVLFAPEMQGWLFEDALELVIRHQDACDGQIILVFDHTDQADKYRKYMKSR